MFVKRVATRFTLARTRDIITSTRALNSRCLTVSNNLASHIASANMQDGGVTLNLIYLLL